MGRDIYCAIQHEFQFERGVIQLSVQWRCMMFKIIIRVLKVKTLLITTLEK